jgi:hypothetical protein
LIDDTRLANARSALLVLLRDVDTFDDDPVLGSPDDAHRTPLSFVLTGDDDNLVAPPDLHIRLTFTKLF